VTWSMLSVVPCLLLSFALADPGNIYIHNTHGDTRTIDHLTPDYIAGPWMRLPEEHPFVAFSDRPRLQRIAELLVRVESSVKYMSGMALSLAAQSNAEQTKIIEEGQHAIKTLLEQIAAIPSRDHAHAQISPTQNHITSNVTELSKFLNHVSHVYQADAEIRFPIAERVTEYSWDLQTALRGRADTICRLHPFLPAAALNQLTDQYDHVVTVIQEKLHKELTISKALVQPLANSINSTETKIRASRAKIQSLQEQFKQFMKDADGFIPNEITFRQIALNDENALVDAMILANEVHHSVLNSTRDLFAEQMNEHHRIISIMEAMTHDSVEQLQSAYEKPKALQFPTQQLDI